MHKVDTIVLNSIQLIDIFVYYILLVVIMLIVTDELMYYFPSIKLELYMLSILHTKIFISIMVAICLYLILVIKFVTALTNYDYNSTNSTNSTNSINYKEYLNKLHQVSFINGLCVTVFVLTMGLLSEFKVLRILIG